MERAAHEAIHSPEHRMEEFAGVGGFVEAIQIQLADER